MRTIGEGCPAAAGALEVKAFDKDVSDRFRGIPRDGTGIMRDDFTVATVTGMGVSEVEQIL